MVKRVGHERQTTVRLAVLSFRRFEEWLADHGRRTHVYLAVDSGRRDLALVADTIMGGL